ncbi:MULTISPECIES: ATP-binding protein [Petrotoga]|uniref:2-oxoglutarate ferredoxin oxidoreductase subunit delta n=2 Tax=Petrotoga sibirica TaxID=156202 RepID=A0A4V3GR07_9BACT|nr:MULTISPECIES: 4Fe-4S binding protein [Petrotoga]KUK83641.1 MAG: 4Fe-4S ferredoxin iron-sulfur binding domain protein [Petrotoga mobilis]POZ88022.1 ferredoxin [Petrotoga sibirica DSM 13575]POZ90112.1 ferredoxin [Petrotoga sp. SL27]TDX17113.1 2-oxoglutarate ferredoxin oxidoreductase subunit delta [Petrotoga sibirica]
MQTIKKQFKVNINYNYCKKCGICSWICPVNAIIEEEFGKPVVPFQEKCTGCLQCERMCPDFAISIKQLDQ